MLLDFFLFYKVIITIGQIFSLLFSPPCITLECVTTLPIVWFNWVTTWFFLKQISSKYYYEQVAFDFVEEVLVY